MRDNVALRRYAQRHTETGLPNYHFTQSWWHHVVVLPAYREVAALLEKLTQLPPGQGRTLVILALNRPDSDADLHANSDLRQAITQSSLPRANRESVPTLCLNRHSDLYLLDMESDYGPTPAASGVGLARKTGCDLALQWMMTGGISGRWICNTDADAILPPDYFEQLDSAAPDAVAAVFPFRHIPTGDNACNTATALYELHLHHYVLGLEYAGSPYAYHTLGSCLAVRANAYAHVRGFPKRAGAEDFYMVNKLAKLGPIARLQGADVQLQARYSSRVPFGTGPAVQAIIAAEQPQDAPLFYHPGCFSALAALLASLPELSQDSDNNITRLLITHGLDPVLAAQSKRSLENLGVKSALAHCRRQSKSCSQFQRQFHQWFDAFRTLKFIHAIGDAGWPRQSQTQLENQPPCFWPAISGKSYTADLLRNSIRRLNQDGVGLV